MKNHQLKLNNMEDKYKIIMIMCGIKKDMMLCYKDYD